MMGLFSRNESPRADDTATGKLNLSAWEQWLVGKAKDERMKIHQKSLQVNFTTVP